MDADAATRPPAEATDGVLFLRCTDILADNRSFYAERARRKGFRLLRCAVENRGPVEVVIQPSVSRLEAGGRSFLPEPRRRVVRKLSFFSWDFLAYLLLDFGWLTALGDLFFFTTGALANRKLRKEVAGIAEADTPVAAGASWSGILAFRKVPAGAATLVLGYLPRGGGARGLRCPV